MKQGDQVMIVRNCRCGAELRMGSVFIVEWVDPHYDLTQCEGCATIRIDVLVRLRGYPYDDEDCAHPQSFLRKLDPLPEDAQNLSVACNV